MHDWIFLIAAISDHGDVAGVDGRTRRIGSVITVVEVPSGKAVEAYIDAAQGYCAADGTLNAGQGKAVNPEIGESYILCGRGHDNTVGRVVIDAGIVGVARTRVGWLAGLNALRVTG